MTHASAAYSGWEERSTARVLHSARRRAVEQSRRIVAAAREIVAESGLDGLTVQKVRERTGLSLRAFYQRFVGKDDLLVAVFEETLRDAATTLAARTAAVADPVETLRMLVSRFFADDERMSGALGPICRAALALPAPERAALVMVDLDVCQFLSDGRRITAVVDTEGYVVGPRELDLIALEYLLDQAGAAAFARGYRTVLPLPDLAPVRTIYRYLYLLLEVQGQADFDEWMRWPSLFD